MLHPVILSTSDNKKGGEVCMAKKVSVLWLEEVVLLHAEHTRLVV